MHRNGENIFNTICSNCGKAHEGELDNSVGIPLCKSCGGKLRPDVVLFGENLDESNIRKAQEASAGCEIFFSIGTSSLVEPAASLPFLAKANGSYVVEINSEETPLSAHANECLRGSAAKVLPALVILIKKLQS